MSGMPYWHTEQWSEVSVCRTQTGAGWGLCGGGKIKMGVMSIAALESEPNLGNVTVKRK